VQNARNERLFLLTKEAFPMMTKGTLGSSPNPDKRPAIYPLHAAGCPLNDPAFIIAAG